jgi:hypothetical protein
MQIIDIPIEDITPYGNNPRRNDVAVGAVAASIKEFGFKVPIIIDKDNVVIAGHTRLKAAKLLSLPVVPCVRADDLTEQQARALRLADNKVGELASWDWSALTDELETIIDVDMEDFGFNLDDIIDTKFDEIEQRETEHAEQKVEMAKRVCKMLNTEYAMYMPGAGPYNMPEMLPVTDLPDIDEWITFNYSTGEPVPENKGVCFYLHDYQFERVWSEPDKYVQILSQFAAVAAPDFSPLGGCPRITQLWNHYRKMWCGRYWQDHGMTVIPTITRSSDADSLEWFLDGVPDGGIVMTNSNWTNTDEEIAEFMKGWDRLIQERHPRKVLIYGRVLDCMTGTEVECVPNLMSKRWG